MPYLASLCFTAAQIIIYHEMEERLETASLTEITVPAGEIVWLKKGKEILVNNEPFDIKSCKLSNGVFHICGLYDKKEKELKKLLSEEQHSSQKKMYSLIFSGLYFRQSLSEQSLFNQETVHSYNLLSNDHFLSAFLKTEKKPPRSCS